MHGKLVVTGSVTDSLAALTRMSMTPRRYTTSTALESLTEAAAAMAKSGITNQDLVDEYGAKASLDSTLCAMFQLSIKASVYKSWKRRRNVTTRTVQPLSCYKETDPVEKDGLIDLAPVKCKPEKQCCLTSSLKAKNSDIKVLVETIKNLPSKTENNTRHKVLHEISRKPTDPVSETYCKGLGDAYFALFCPDDAVILTTNVRDHRPLAESLKKEATEPKEL